MADTYTAITDALTAANVTARPLLVGADEVPSGLSAIWRSLGQSINVNSDDAMEVGSETFEIQFWLPTAADDALTNYATITGKLVETVAALVNGGRVGLIELVEDGYDGEVETGAGQPPGVLVRTMQVEVLP